MINVFAVFTGKLLKIVQKSSFRKTCYLEAKSNVLHNFCTGTVILTFLKFAHDKRFCCFYWKTAEYSAKKQFS